MKRKEPTAFDNFRWNLLDWMYERSSFFWFAVAAALAFKLFLT